MQTGCAGTACAFAARIESTSMFTVDNLVQQTIQFRFEHCLQSAEHESTTGGGEDEEAEM